MELDIVAYEGVGKFLGENKQHWYPDNVAHLSTNPGWKEKSELDYNGYYEVRGKSYSFRAGSYSGYGYWRRWLSEIFLGVKPEEIWENPKKFKGKPFVELIDFTDCDGVLGKTVCKKLAEDFQAAVLFEKDEQDADGHHIITFRNFQKAFELAAEKGVVLFC